MSAPSVRGASHWMAWRTAGCRRAQARWGARLAGGTLYTGTATIAVTWRHPPAHPHSPSPPPPPPARALPPPRPAPPRGAPQRPCPQPPPRDPREVGPRQVGGRAPPAPGRVHCVSRSGWRAGWHRRPATPTQDLGRAREPHKPLSGPGPSFLCFPGPAILPPKEKSEPPARRAVSSPSSDGGSRGRAGGEVLPPFGLFQRKPNCTGFVGTPGLTTATGRRHARALAGLVPGARRQRPTQSNLCARPQARRARPFPQPLALFFELLTFARLCKLDGESRIGIFPRVGEPLAKRGPAGQTPQTTGFWSQALLSEAASGRGPEGDNSP